MAYTTPIRLRKPTAITGLFQVDFGKPGEQFWCGMIRWSKRGTVAANAPFINGYTSTMNGVPSTVHVPPSGTTAQTQPHVMGNIDAGVVDSLPDNFFYVRELVAGNKILAAPYWTNGSSDVQAHWQPHLFRGVSGRGFRGIIVDGQGDCMAITRKRDTNGDIFPSLKNFYPNNRFVVDSGSPMTGLSSATFAIQKVRVVTQFANSIVYGGFSSYNPSEVPSAQYDHKPHWIVFSDTLGTDYGPYSVDSTTTLQVGSGPSEPVTAMVENVIVNDAVNAKGQLLVFTNKQIQVFDGIPPQPGVPLDASFMGTALAGIGTWAPYSVVNTPHGVMFLATDGGIYLVPQHGKPILLSAELRPYMEKLNPIQQSLVCAAWFKDHYVVCMPKPRSKQVRNTEMWMGNFRDGVENVRWYGPHPDMHFSRLAVGVSSDGAQLMGGSNQSSQIIELMREDVNTFAPWPNTPTADFSGVVTTQRKIKPRFILNALDGGDIHTDLSLVSTRLGIKASFSADLTLNIAALSQDLENGAFVVGQEEYNETVEPGLGQLGAAGTNLQVGVNEGFEVPVKYATKRIRGRALVVEARVEPNASATGDPKIKLFELTLTINKKARR